MIMTILSESNCLVAALTQMCFPCDQPAIPLPPEGWRQSAMDEHLFSYLPQDRRSALASDTPLPDRATGVALFADISGFTPLTAWFAEQFGPRRRAEGLTAWLNR